MRPSSHHRLALCWLTAASLLGTACPAEDNGGSGADGDLGGNDTGGDSALDSAGGGDSVLADDVIGAYSVISVTLGTSTLTTENADLGDGVQRRVSGTLGIDADGTYTRHFEFFEDDVSSETEDASGTWVLESDTIVVITEAGEAPSRVQLSISGNTLTMTRIESTPSFEVDEMVVQRLTR